MKKAAVLILNNEWGESLCAYQGWWQVHWPPAHARKTPEWVRRPGLGPTSVQFCPVKRWRSMCCLDNTPPGRAMGAELAAGMSQRHTQYWHYLGNLSVVTLEGLTHPALFPVIYHHSLQAQSHTHYSLHVSGFPHKISHLYFSHSSFCLT